MIALALGAGLLVSADVVVYWDSNFFEFNPVSY